jgi:hypothetical protein
VFAFPSPLLLRQTRHGLWLSTTCATSHLSSSPQGVHALANVAHLDILQTLNKEKQKPGTSFFSAASTARRPFVLLTPLSVGPDGAPPPYQEEELQNGLNHHLKGTQSLAIS